MSLGLKSLGSYPLSRFCNFVWWAMVRNLKGEQEVAKLKARLWMPPAGVIPTEGPWSPEAEMSAFSGLRAALGGQ
jgi:hypothetical protein